MGWNDHVSFVQTQCLDCGAVDTWEFWDDVAKSRYGGKNKLLGKFLGHDDDKSGKCPLCGSTRGKAFDDDSYGSNF
jgi:hypothetical protein